MRPFALASAALGLLAACAAADAQTVTAEYLITRTGVASDYRIFGYTPEGGSFTPLDGDAIVAASLVLDYSPEPGEDINDLFIGMAVPVDGSVSQFFGVTGDQFTQTSPGTYHYERFTDDFNGTITTGGFGIETYSLDDNGIQTGTDGVYAEGSGFRYTVAVPEPTTAVAGAAGLLLLARRPRRGC